MKALDPRLFRHAAACRRYVIGSACISVTSAGLLIVAAFAISEVIVRPFQEHAGLPQIRGPLTVLAVAVAGRALLAWFGHVSAQRTSTNVKSQLRRSVLRHVVRLGPAWLARHRTGDLATTTTYGLDALDTYFGLYLPALVAATVLPIAVTGVVLSQDLAAGLIILVTLPLIPFFGMLIGSNTERASRRQWRTIQALGGHFLDVVSGLPTLLLFGRARAQVDRIRSHADEHRRATMRTLRIAFLSSAALEFLATISVALVAVSIGLRLADGSLDLRTGLVVLILAPEAYWPLRQVRAHFHASAEGLAAAESILAILETPATSARARSPVPIPEVAHTTLRIEGLSVAYDRATPALHPIDLVVRPGEYVGVSGPSGCGKTTLLLVLLGFVTPTEGRIVMEGPSGRIDLADVDAELWRSRIAWVPQEPWLAAASIADNVRLARPDADSTAVARAMRLANVTNFVSELPQGSASILGENGFGLSAGERQRIALARAFLRDAPLVLLDEPTAHLDPANEAEVSAAVRRLARDRTVIAVAHRPALLAGCDRLVHLAGQMAQATV